jgi:hypothetical protein
MSNYEFHNIIRNLGHCERLMMMFRYAAAPVIHGCRPAALLTIGACCFDAWMESREALLDATGLGCETLLIGDGTFVLMPYRVAALARALTRPGAADILRGRGYFVPDAALGAGADAGELRARLTETHLLPTLTGRYVSYSAGLGAEFPHEIGLFLGYPPEDVAAFIENDGKKLRVQNALEGLPRAGRRAGNLREDRPREERRGRPAHLHVFRKEGAGVRRPGRDGRPQAMFVMG